MNTDVAPDPYRKHRLDEESNLDSFLSETNRLLIKLDDKMKVLPPVDAQGRSTCPLDIAEPLYYAKEEVVSELEARLPALRMYSHAVMQEVERCRRNRSILSAHGSGLHLNAVRFHYQSAESAQANAERRAVQQHARIVETIAKVERALAQAETRKFPGRAPRKTIPFGTPGGTEVGPPIGIAESGLPGVTTAKPVSPSKPGGKTGLNPGIEKLVRLDVAEAGNRSPFVTKPSGQ